jgi:F0F1-type ATP synthase membrane subunit b/b'
MAVLPGELEALKARGTAEIAAEQERIRQQAEVERRRILDQAQRDMDLQVQAVRRDLTRQAAASAVAVAERLIAATITDEDQRRLMAQYVAQLGGTQAQAGATHE